MRCGSGSRRGNGLSWGGHYFTFWLFFGTHAVGELLSEGISTGMEGILKLTLERSYNETKETID